MQLFQTKQKTSGRNDKISSVSMNLHLQIGSLEVLINSLFKCLLASWWTVGMYKKIWAYG